MLYAYNQVNLLSQLTDPDGRQTVYSYNDDNSRTRTAFPNGVSESRTYDRAERVRTIVAKNAAGSVLTDFEYLYTTPTAESSLIQTMKDRQRNTTTAYGYDHLGRLILQDTTGAVSEKYTYRYDGNSARLEASDSTGAPPKSYAYNAANQLCWVYDGSSANTCSNPPAGAKTFSYDKNGNTTASSDGYRFAYNARNQTTSITPPGGAAQAMSYLDSGQTELVDANGTGYLNNGLASGQSIGIRGSDSYVREPGGALHSQKNAAGRAFYLTDSHPGSVVGLTDAAGNMAARYRYDPFGTVQSQTGTLANPLRFAAQELHGTLGLYKMGERWYDPKLGRFTQQDPLNQALDPRQANRYLYAG